VQPGFVIVDEHGGGNVDRVGMTTSGTSGGISFRKSLRDSLESCGPTRLRRVRLKIRESAQGIIHQSMLKW
jgi:hypothetical protein